MENFALLKGTGWVCVKKSSSLETFQKYADQYFDYL